MSTVSESKVPRACAALSGKTDLMNLEETEGTHSLDEGILSTIIVYSHFCGQVAFKS